MADGMCIGKTGSKSCSDDGQHRTIDEAWVWVLLTVLLWLSLLFLVWIVRICSHRQRRRRFLNRVLGPVCRKLGLKVSWADNPDQGASPSSSSAADAVNVFFMTSPSFSDQPPSYEMTMMYINHAYVPAVVPLSPPSYDQITTMTSSPTMTSSETSSPTVASAEPLPEETSSATSENDVSSANTSCDVIVVADSSASAVVSQ